MVYMPMSYLYGKRFVGPITPLILQLRQELYLQPYEQINWMKVRHDVAKVLLLVQEQIYWQFGITCYPTLLHARIHKNKLDTNLSLQEDIYYPHPFIQDLIWDGLYIFAEPLLNRWPCKKLREKALQTTMKHIHYEDENSRYITIGCVEKVM